MARADEFIGELDRGRDTVIGERGVTLSGGQRQRLALARALLRHPRLLILDDATSAVDPRIEQQILAGLRRELDMTTIVVAHRVSTIALADRVLYLDDGRLVADGTHAELLATVPGYEALIRAYEAADSTTSTTWPRHRALGAEPDGRDLTEPRCTSRRAPERARGGAGPRPRGARRRRACRRTEVDELGAIGVLRRGLAVSPELRAGIVFTALMALATAVGKLAVPILIQQTLDRGVLGDDGFNGRLRGRRLRAAPS